ncbi:hypothetical protein, partial [Salmonella sp. s51228]|uniref:hypothetical protein n=1 Tax=Salmonella sp. s51228 TaxID=3159652 RepID=UPI00397EDAD4
MDKIVEASQGAITNDQTSLVKLGSSAENVSTALKDLIEYISSGLGQGGGQYDEVCEAILLAQENFAASIGNPRQMITQAEGLAKATNELIKALKADASKQSDPNARQRLLDAAKQLTDATSKMVTAASTSAANLHDPIAQNNLKLAVDDLKLATNAAASQAMKRKVIRK